MRARSPDWTEERITEHLSSACKSFGRFPSQQECKALGLTGLLNAVRRKGGLQRWWSEMATLGYQPKDRRKQFGFNGEDEVGKLLENNGFFVEIEKSRRNHFDITVAGVLRVEVKSACLNENIRDRDSRHAPCWHYTVNRKVTADVVALYRADRKDVLFLPWFLVSETSISIGQTSKYDLFLNNYEMLRAMVLTRSHEKAMLLSANTGADRK